MSRPAPSVTFSIARSMHPAAWVDLPVSDVTGIDDGLWLFRFTEVRRGERHVLFGVLFVDRERRHVETTGPVHGYVRPLFEGEQ